MFEWLVALASWLDSPIKFYATNGEFLIAFILSIGMIGLGLYLKGYDDGMNAT
jgi:hypothetical protein